MTFTAIEKELRAVTSQQSSMILLMTMGTDEDSIFGESERDYCDQLVLFLKKRSKKQPVKITNLKSEIRDFECKSDFKSIMYDSLS